MNEVYILNKGKNSAILFSPKSNEYSFPLAFSSLEKAIYKLVNIYFKLKKEEKERMVSSSSTKIFSMWLTRHMDFSIDVVKLDGDYIKNIEAYYIWNLILEKYHNLLAKLQLAGFESGSIGEIERIKS